MKAASPVEAAAEVAAATAEVPSAAVASAATCQRGARGHGDGEGRAGGDEQSPQGHGGHVLSTRKL